MAYKVVLPRRNAFTYQSKGILSAACLLINTYREVTHTAGHVRKVLVLAELVGHSANGYAEQRSACRHALRHNDGAPLVVDARRYGCRAFYSAVLRHRAVSQVYGGLTAKVGYQYGFLRLYPFSCLKARSLYKGYTGVGHAVAHRQAHHACCRSHVLGLAPKEVAGLVAAHRAVLRRCALVALHGKAVGVYALGRAEGVIAIHVDVRVLVLPIQVVGRVPLISGLVKRMPNIVSSVSADLQRAGRIAVVVDNVDAHHVAVAKSVVVYSRNRHLVNLTGQGYRHFAADESVTVEEVVGAACQ